MVAAFGPELLNRLSVTRDTYIYSTYYCSCERFSKEVHVRTDRHYNVPLDGLTRFTVIFAMLLRHEVIRRAAVTTIVERDTPTRGTIVVHKKRSNINIIA